MDTGTSLLYLPSDIVDFYYSKVSGAEFSKSQGGFIFPCSTSLPDINVAIGNKTFTVPGQYVSYTPVPDDSLSCFGGIQRNTNFKISILSDIFLKSVYAIFEIQNGHARLGFLAQPFTPAGHEAGAVCTAYTNGTSYQK